LPSSKIDDRMIAIASVGGTISHLCQDNYPLENLIFTTIARDENFIQQTFLKVALFTDSTILFLFQGSSERLLTYKYARVVSCLGGCSTDHSTLQERDRSTSLRKLQSRRPETKLVLVLLGEEADLVDRLVWESLERSMQIHYSESPMDRAGRFCRIKI